jgi:hypothetical protein
MTGQEQPKALRLVFERIGKEVRLVETIPIDMVVPPGDDLDVDDTQRTGFAVRVYGEDGNLTYRRLMADPLALEAEVYTGDPDQPWERRPIEEDYVQFEVVVPNTGEDIEVELIASPPRHGPEYEPARLITRLPVRGLGPGHGTGDGRHEDARDARNRPDQDPNGRRS